MRRTSIIKITIQRPYDEVLAFLDEPLNFPQWGAVPDAYMEHLGERDYLVELPGGRKVMRFAEPNPYGVLDYEVFAQGEKAGPVTPVRVYRNDNGAEMIFTWFQNAGTSDEQFASEVNWIESDLLRLKALLEQV